MFDVDFVIATHNRSNLLVRTLASFSRLRLPPGRSFRVTVVANNCSDDTRDVVTRFATCSAFPLRCLEEPVPGKSAALNTGVTACDAEWIGFIDDDEQILPDWLEVFDESRHRLGFDYAGGRYLADYEIPAPRWLPPRHIAPVIACHADDVVECRVADGQSLVWGGNFIVRRDALLRTGTFDVGFARHASLLALGCEDADMVRRLLAAGFTGWFVPSMQILHWIPGERLTRGFFRRKIFGHGYTGRRYEQARPASARPAPRLLGLPRWRWRKALSGIAALCIATARGARSEAFGHELDLWWIAGYLKAARDGS